MNELKILIFLVGFSFYGNILCGQSDSLMLAKIHEHTLIKGQSYSNLEELCKNIGHRLTASPQSYKAIEWGKKKLDELKLDSVWLQPITVPHWVRGDIERLDFSNKNTPIHVSHCTALGGSIGTNGKVISGQVIEIKNWDELDSKTEKEIKGKVVFFNQPMNPALINTFRAYGGCAGYRMYGSMKAAEKGVSAVIIRSLTLKNDENPHTGMMKYVDSIAKIPGVAISSKDAYILSNMIKEDPNTSIKLKLSCQILPDTVSYNVIGELRGSEKPEEIILVGGHLDSWDIGEGAHDDGAGVVQSLETIRTFQMLQIKPKHTIRCVLYMNEENGNMGGKGYAKYASEYHEKHLFALETDRGGFSPRGFSIDGTEEQLKFIQDFEELFAPYWIHLFEKGHGGVDIGPLKDGKVCLVGLMPDTQRYFDFHHAKSDVLENVNERELKLGSAAITSLIYLIDRHW
ncbi:MAG: M20/M25/M40 family metallo-hydrolase [Flavobacteriales bacterium]|nr:M20/M25/M40 family metallo-hydrolase [Flavobacteriales bacterium]